MVVSSAENWLHQWFQTYKSIIYILFTFLNFWGESVLTPWISLTSTTNRPISGPFSPKYFILNAGSEDWKNICPTAVCTAVYIWCGWSKGTMSSCHGTSSMSCPFVYPSVCQSVSRHSKHYPIVKGRKYRKGSCSWYLFGCYFVNGKINWWLVLLDCSTNSLHSLTTPPLLVRLLSVSEK